MLKRISRKITKNEKGAAIIEFAIILPVLLALVIVIVELGWIFNGYITLTGAAREGARLAARGEAPGIVAGAVQRHSATFRGSNPTTSIEPNNYETSYPDSITVKVEGNLTFLTGIYAGSINIPAEATMRREFNP